MITKERRFSDRYLGASLTLELQPRYWFGLKKEKHPALVTNFATGGAAITTPLKLNIGQRVQVSILSEFHNIRQLQAEIVRYDGRHVDYKYVVRFHFEKLPEIARNNTLFVLKQIERALKRSRSSH
ncbi:MAG: hypothetical protein ACI9EX_000332 [Oleispira sp.]